MSSTRVPQADPTIRGLSFAEGLVAAARRWDRFGSDPQIVAVDGHSAAGKSTFAVALGARTGAALVPGNDFYRVMDEDARGRLSAREGIDRYYDWKRMRDEVLVPLSAGRDAVYRPYDWESGLLAEHVVTIRAAPVVVVEGVFVSRPQLGEFIGLSVLVEVPATVRWARQLGRGDSLERLRRWEAAEALFFAKVRPSQSFDLVVLGQIEIDKQGSSVTPLAPFGTLPHIRPAAKRRQ